ncbi:MAG TPA: hypothetical protein VLL08_30030 [Kineosporiaceae bacterium]|nr:hypothetical protein [Kineosporiaceae bacterium]
MSIHGLLAGEAALAPGGALRGLASAGAENVAATKSPAIETTAGTLRTFILNSFA